MSDDRPLLEQEISSQLRLALEDRRSDVPSDAQVERIELSLGPLLSPDGGGGGPEGGGPEGGLPPGATGGGLSGAAGASAALSVSGTKLAIGAALCLAAGAGAMGGVLQLVGEPSPDPRSETPSFAHVVESSGEASTAELLDTVEPSQEPVGVDLSPTAANQRPTSVRPGQGLPLPEATNPSPPPDPLVEPEPRSELELVREARAGLATSPQASLRLMAEHARAYPEGRLSQEREVVIIEALVRLGQRDDAEGRASRFRTRYPGSSHLRRIETLLSGTP